MRLLLNGRPAGAPRGVRACPEGGWARSEAGEVSEAGPALPVPRRALPCGECSPPAAGGRAAEVSRLQVSAAPGGQRPDPAAFQDRGGGAEARDGGGGGSAGLSLPFGPDAPRLGRAEPREGRAARCQVLGEF